MSHAPGAPRPYHLEGEIKVHRIAQKHFLRPTADKRIADSIRKQGAIEHVTTYDDMLLDGQERDKANIDQGLERWAIRFEDTSQGIAAAAHGREAMDRAALDYLIAKNLERKHYTQGQLAMMGARMPHREEGRPKKHPSAGEFLRSEAEIAELVGVSTGLLSNAKRILREGTPGQIGAAETAARLSQS